MAGNRERGTPYWALDWVRQGMLPSLFADLRSFEESGIPRPVCDVIHATLEKTHVHVRNTIATIPSTDTHHSSLTRIAEIVRALADLYRQWNHRDEDASAEARSHRRRYMQLLKDQREQFAELMRQVQPPQGLVRDEIDALHTHLVAACTSTPHAQFGAISSRFKRLNSSIKKYGKRAV
jgi:hypothetical protein